jgi:hypothetical protein
MRLFLCLCKRTDRRRGFFELARALLASVERNAWERSGRGAGFACIVSALGW